LEAKKIVKIKITLSRNVKEGPIKVLVLTSIAIIPLGITSKAQEQERIKELISRLGSDDFKLREKATDELIGLGREVERFLKEILDHQDPEVRERARHILRIIPLKERLGDRVWEKVPKFVKKLAYAEGPGERREIYEELICKKEVLGRDVVVLFLEKVFDAIAEDRTPIAELVILNNISSGWRIVARCIEEERRPAWVKWALKALVRWKVKEAGKSILKVVKGKHAVYTRNAAMRALEKLGLAKEFAEAIIIGIKDKAYRLHTNLVRFPITKRMCLEVKNELKQHKDEIIKLLKHENGGVRGKACIILGMLELKECADSIAQLLKDEDKDVRVGAVKGLALLGEKRYLKDIAKLAKDKEPCVRRAVGTALCKLGGGKKDIRRLLNDKDRWLREHMTQVLKKYYPDIEIALELLKERLRREISKSLHDKINKAIRYLENRR
jgi:HEAT repeat protein